MGKMGEVRNPYIRLTGTGVGKAKEKMGLTK